jgi:hypothetical protein
MAVALLASGCSEDEPGIASPQRSSEVPSGPVTQESSPGPSSQNSSDMSGVEPCSIIEPEELVEIGAYEEGSSRLANSGRVCEWKEQRGPDGVSATLTLTIREGANLDSVRDLGSGLQRGIIEASGRKVVRTWNTQHTGCLVVMAVSQNERVEVGLSEVSGSFDNEEACRMVDKVVEIVDPKLPLG